MKLRLIIIPVCVVVAVGAVVSWTIRSPADRGDVGFAAPPADDLLGMVQRVDEHFATSWKNQGLTAARNADELTVLRRLSLSLHGTIPSLEEIRMFEADDRPGRLNRWTANMLDDSRFADYFAERLARSFVGVEEGQFIVFRRDRFVDWLAEQLREKTPYDDLVKQLIAGQGLWTGKPETNFVTATIVDGEVDENKLAGRAVRAFLGQRIDCAQCHDHPFDDWKQGDFEGLAAFFGQARLSVVGVEEKSDREFEVEDRKTLEKRTVAPLVPFHPEWIPADGTGNRREQLAAWVTHPDNRRFERAIANRIWGLLFGKPYLAPVDDLPDPGDMNDPDLLDILGTDFREHGYDLRRLIQVIAASRAFRLASTYSSDDPAEIEQLEQEWALFPLVRLRPEQVIGSMFQAASVKTIDQNSHLLFRTIRYFREQDFVREYGDLGEAELENRSVTIPQTLLRMNGKLSRELSEANPFSAAGRILSMSSTDEKCLETCYLVCLSRRPEKAEQTHFLAELSEAKNKQRNKVVEDIVWSLYNSPEFSLNH